MRFNWRQKNPLWFLLFIINKIAIPILRRSLLNNLFIYTAFLKTFQIKGSNASDLLPEMWMAVIIFGATLTLFLKFTVETIQQITTYLGIYCLTIKPKDT